MCLVIKDKRQIKRFIKHFQIKPCKNISYILLVPSDFLIFKVEIYYITEPIMNLFSVDASEINNWLTKWCKISIY